MSHDLSPRVVLIVPTYNERENLPRLVERIPAAPAADLLFVDDGSRDGTAEWVRELATRRPGVHLLERPRKMGLGTAYVAGFRWALDRGYDLVFEMDADLSHDPSEIPNFARKAEEGADLVVGSRYVDGIRIINWPLRRLILSRFASAYTRFWTGLPLTDPTSGFKCFRREALAALDLGREGHDPHPALREDREAIEMRRGERRDGRFGNAAPPRGIDVGSLDVDADDPARELGLGIAVDLRHCDAAVVLRGELLEYRRE